MPAFATIAMLGFLTTDAAISKELLQEALSENVVDTFNMISVDGDTSTNDYSIHTPVNPYRHWQCLRSLRLPVHKTNVLQPPYPR